MHTGHLIVNFRKKIRFTLGHSRINFQPVLKLYKSLSENENEQRKAVNIKGNKYPKPYSRRRIKGLF